MDAVDRKPKWNPADEDLSKVDYRDSTIMPSTFVKGIDDRKPPGFFESLDKERATEDELKSIGKKRSKKPVDVLGLDAENGLYTCPTCKKAGSNPGCFNCFHDPYRGDDPFDFNPEASK